MLGANNRMKKNKDFRFVYRHGKNIASRYVAMVFVKSRNADKLLVGFSVSKKVANAVGRNKVMLLMRVYVLKHINDRQCVYRIIFIGRFVAKDASYEKIGNDIHKLLKKAKLITAK